MVTRFAISSHRHPLRVLLLLPLNRTSALQTHCHKAESIPCKPVAFGDTLVLLLPKHPQCRTNCDWGFTTGEIDNLLRLLLRRSATEQNKKVPVSFNNFAECVPKAPITLTSFVVLFTTYSTSASIFPSPNEHLKETVSAMAGPASRAINT